MALLFNYIVKFTGWPIWAALARTKVHYVDKATQSRKLRGKAIVISNHTEVWDYAALMFLFPFRILHCVVAELMYEKNAFMAFIIKALGSVRVDRNSPDFAFIGKCVSILDRGGVVEFYPEARIPKGETELLPFKPSITYLALESGAPIIPVYTDGNYFGKGRNHILIGTPLDVRQLYDDSKSEKENIVYITEYLRGHINELRVRLNQELSKD